MAPGSGVGALAPRRANTRDDGATASRAPPIAHVLAETLRNALNLHHICRSVLVARLQRVGTRGKCVCMWWWWGGKCVCMWWWGGGKCVCMWWWGGGKCVCKAAPKSVCDSSRSVLGDSTVPSNSAYCDCGAAPASSTVTTPSSH